MRSLIALVPSYQPSRILVQLASELEAEGFKSIIVDDGSGEEYSKIFKEAEQYATVISHGENRGKGCALKTGLEYIHRRFAGKYTVVTLDSDGQHRVEDAVNIGEEAEKNPGFLVLGSRGFCGDVPLRSRFGNTVTRLVYKLSTGTAVQDTQTGLRAFDSKIMPFMLSVEGERYEYEMNVLLACSRNDIPIKEVEIETIYIDHNSASHFDTVKDSIRIYREIVKFAASSFTSFLVDYGMYSVLVVASAGLGTAVSVPLSNIAARVISSGVNFTLNRHLVFKSKERVGKSAFQYFSLVAFILLANTLLLSFLVDGLGADKFFAKILTEITFFTTSWIVQKHWIFKKNVIDHATRKGIEAHGK